MKHYFKVMGTAALVFSVFATATGLAAEPAFKQGDIFLDLGIGAGKPGGAAINAAKDTTFYQLEAIFNLSSSLADRRTLGLAQLASLKSPTASSVSGRLGFEYGVNDIFGFGVSLNSAKAKVNPAYVSNFESFGVLSFLGTAFCSGLTCPSQAPGVFEYLTLDSGPAETKAFNTLDFDFSFHIFTTDVYDPYIRITVGLGKIDDTNLAKAGLAFGTRYMVSDSVYVMGEISGSAYSIVLSASESASGSSETVDAITNNELRLGVGVKF